MIQLKNKKYFWLLVTLLLTIPAFFFLLKPGYFNMHDDMQMIRQLELEKCIQDGQIPCRWSPDLGYGYGYPLFNFYPSMPYLVGQLFRTFGSTFVNTVKLTAISQFVFSALGMYLLAASVFGPLGGLISSLFYTYAPYHAVNVYIRGAMNEAWAAVFFPFIFYFSKKLIEKPKITNIFGLALSFTGLLLSHNPMAFTFSPILLVWIIYHLFKNNKFKKSQFINLGLKKILPSILAGLLSLGLAAFYTLPVIFETKFVQLESMFKNYYHFSVHFTSINQLFLSRFWGDGASVWGQEDQMSFQIGYLHWFIPTVTILYCLYSKIKKIKLNKKVTLACLLALLGFFAAFMTHQRAVFIWKLFPIIQKTQFPWRFLNHTVFLFSLSIGILPYLLTRLSKPFHKHFLATFVLLLAIFNLNYFHPLKSGPITDAQKFSGKAWTNQITSGIYDYLPKTARIAARGPAKNYIDEIYPATSVYQVTGGKKGTDWLFFNLKLEQNSKIFLPLLAFPNWEVKDNHTLIDHTIEPELGRIVLNLSKGQHQLYIKLRNTPIRNISNIISLLSWTYLLVRSYQLLWKKFKSNK